jgi:putative oxidoreductase
VTVGRSVLRLVVGGLMAGHGLQKLRGSFGGPGLEGTEQMMASLGMHPARVQAYAAGLAETVGGSLTALGLASPLGPAILSGVMATAIRKVHLSKGLWVANGGYEYNIVLMGVAFALAVEGPGRLSLDALLGAKRKGLRWGLLELALALAVAFANIELAKRMAPASQEQREASQDEA